MSRLSGLEDIAVCTVLGGLCVPVFAWLVPDFEMSVREARMAQAWIQVRQLQQIVQAETGTDQLRTPEDVLQE